MKSATAGLISLLNSSNTFLMADLYTITLVGGTVLRYTSADGTLIVAGHSYDGTTLLIERSKVRTMIGVEVDTLDLTLQALPTHLIGSTPFLKALKAGALDGASVKVERCFMPTWGDTSLGTVILFSGRVADMEVGRTEARIRVNSDLELLNIQMPRNLYQPGCLNTLFDTACSLNKAAHAVAGAYGTGSAASFVPVGLANAAGWFDMGTLTFTSGVNAGVSRSIKSYTPSAIVLMTPFVSSSTPGDTFLAYPGCHKTQAECSGKFSNIINFRGFPYVPEPESVT